MSEIPTWDKITNAQGSTTTEFGGNWANLISDYYNGVNVGLTDPSKIPIIGTLTRYKFEKLGIFDPDQSHYIILSADDIDTGPTRKVKFRRMNSPYTDDYAVLEGMPQTLLNKTMDLSLNSITNIVNANISSSAAITDSKLAQITNKAKLPSSTVYNDQTNSFGDFDQVFKDNRLRINNPADTFSYTVIGAAIAANRNLTLPLLTGNDVVVTEAFAQTLTNKTIVAGSNSISGIVDANITAHTTTKITTTSKSLLNSSIMYTDQSNSIGDFNQTFKDDKLLINNPADTFAYTFIAAAIAANRSITLPLLTGNDTMVTAAFAQTLTNKTIDADSNTITNIDNSEIKAAAGIVYSKLSLANSIVNADIASGAAIVTTKLADSANFILKTLDNAFGAHYQDFTKMTAPANPGANDIRLYVDTADTHMKIRNSAGTIVDLHTGGGGGATNLDALTDVDLTTVAPVNGDVLTYTTTGTKWIPSAPPGAGGGITASSTDTLTNKSINADNNTITNIDNNEIKAAAGIVTSKLADSANFILGNQTNTFGDFNQIFRDNRLLINNPADTFNYTIIAAAIAANRTVTLPLLTGNDTFVTEAFTQTLTNKTLTTPVISSISNTGTLTLPTSTDTLVGKATTDTFTNKTFNADGTGNSITNIEDADIKAGAAIVTTKLADSANFILKTLDNSFGAHYHDITKMTAPGNPGANDIRVYVDTSDTHLKIKNSAGTVVDLHSAGGSGAPTSASYVTLGTDATLSSERVLTAGTNTSFTDGGAGSTLTVNVPDGTTTVKGAVELATSGENAANVVVQGNDSRLSDSRTPTSHATSHKLDGSDALVLKGLRTASLAVSTTPVTLSATTDQFVKVDASGGARTVNLPAVSGLDGQYYSIVKSDSSANTVTIDGSGSETINGATTLVLTSQYQSFVLRCDGAAWFTTPNTSERTGTASGTANGSTTVFNIAHGLGSNPYSSFVMVSSSLGSTINYSWTTDSTNLIVTFASAPSSGTVTFQWRAVL